MTPPQAAYRAAGNAYQLQAVETAAPAQLVLMLYDGALGAIARAERALADGGLGAFDIANRELTRAQDIITELRLSLDHDLGGPIASSLDGIYGFCLDQLTQANLRKDRSPLAFVSKALADLRDAFGHAAAEVAAAS